MNNNRWCLKFRFSHANVQSIEYSSNYSETTGSLWFNFKDEVTNFNSNIENTDNFKSFKYKAKLLENTEADGVNETRKNATIVVALINWNVVN